MEFIPILRENFTTGKKLFDFFGSYGTEFIRNRHICCCVFFCAVNLKPGIFFFHFLPCENLFIKTISPQKDPGNQCAGVLFLLNIYSFIQSFNPGKSNVENKSWSVSSLLICRICPFSETIISLCLSRPL